MIGTVRNLSLEGLFLALGIVPCKADDEVEVLFSFPEAGPRRVPHRIPSRVAHVRADGLGVEFLRFDPTLFRTVERLLERGAPPR